MDKSFVVFPDGTVHVFTTDTPSDNLVEFDAD